MADASTSGLETWRRFARLPRRARTAAVVVLAAAGLPGAVAVVDLVGDLPGGGVPRAQPHVVNLVAACVAVAVLIAFEPPRSASPFAYVRQLHARFLELQTTFDADDRRRPGEGKEKEDDCVSSEP